jgi:hypothetical protein
MRTRFCYLDCHEAGLWCYLLRPLPIYWLCLVVFKGSKLVVVARNPLYTLKRKKQIQLNSIGLNHSVEKNKLIGVNVTCNRHLPTARTWTLIGLLRYILYARCFGSWLCCCSQMISFLYTDAGMTIIITQLTLLKQLLAVSYRGSLMESRSRVWFLIITVVRMNAGSFSFPEMLFPSVQMFPDLSHCILGPSFQRTRAFLPFL